MIVALLIKTKKLSLFNRAKQAIRGLFRSRKLYKNLFDYILTSLNKLELKN